MYGPVQPKDAISTKAGLVGQCFARKHFNLREALVMHKPRM